MQRVLVSAGIVMICCSAPALAAAATPIETQLSQLEQRAAKAATSAAGEYSRDLLDAARSSITEAKISIASARETLAARQAEMAEMQLNAAEAKAAEKELLEKVAVRRSELKKLGARLERFQQGEEN